MPNFTFASAKGLFNRKKSTPKVTVTVPSSSSNSKPSPSADSSKFEFLAALTNADIKGSIRSQGHIDYDIDTIPWNLRCRPKPVAIVHAANPQDVSIAVKVAARFGIPVQPRSGGHSYAAYSLGGRSGALIIDLAHMDQVVVDQKTWKATIGGGTRLEKVTKELFAQGKRTIAHGTCPQVGIGGHATIGGQGPLSRMYGLTLDHVLEVEVVLADGTITNANASEKPDLFWALRGAGASFGIVTSFTFETHPTPDTVTHYAFQLTIASSSDLATAFTKWQSFISTPAVLNDRAYNSLVSVTGSGLLVQGTRYGSRAELEASEAHILLRSHFEFKPVDIKIWELDWLASIVHWASDEINTISGGLSISAYMKSFTVRQSKPLEPKAIENLFDYIHTHKPHDTICVVLADLEGGRISDFSNDATAYAQRDALYNICVYAIAPLPFPDDVLAYLNGMIDTVQDAMPDGNFGVYPGYVDPLIPKTRWPTQYWGANYPRLLEIKKKYDPKQVFSNPQSVGS
jgi:FAD/FMN-containing dehydrogenase